MSNMTDHGQPIRVVVEFANTERGLKLASKAQEDIENRLGYDTVLVLPQGREETAS